MSKYLLKCAVCFIANFLHSNLLPHLHTCFTFPAIVVNRIQPTLSVADQQTTVTGAELGKDCSRKA